MQSNNSIEALNSINHKLSQLPKSETQRSIFRVHKELRNVNIKAYEPNIVAIGPYHHGKDDLKMMEEHKLCYLQLLLESRQQNVERYISVIGELEQKARDCYAEPISLSGAQFVEMLVLDGCFIIEFVRKYYNEDPTWDSDPLFKTGWISGSLRRDLILFENHIPFFVLCKLFDLIEGRNKHQMLMKYLIRFCGPNGLFPSQRLQMRTSRSSVEIKHLLDLVYYIWLSSTDDIFLHIEGESSLPSRGVWNFIPSATELKGANVEFQKKERDPFFEVTFKNGIMEMPPLTFDDGTEYLLRNLIVYEQYFLRGKRSLVTDYVILLDYFINSSKDVEILSKCGIINNCLGNYEVVANIINQLNVSITCSTNCSVYAKMFADVNIYYKKPWNGWMAMLRRDIFYSPWAYLSFFAALGILVLSIIQATCSILQVV